MLIAQILDRHLLRRDKLSVIRDKLPTKRDVIVYCHLAPVQVSSALRGGGGAPYSRMGPFRL